jgi:hypothetical protein
MSRPVACVFTAAIMAVAGPSFAQTTRAPKVVSVQAAVRSGVVRGVVRDDGGAGVAGVAVTAVGTSLALARTDATGAFYLPLAPGDYVLRATRDGYVSPYKEWLRIGDSARLERNITITRQIGLPDRKVLLASIGVSAPAVMDVRDSTPETSVAPVPSLQAWYLRHLPRTILRDGAGHARHTDFRYLPSFLDWFVTESARATSSFFTETDFSGQVDLLTTHATAVASPGVSGQIPRGIAYVSLGAPVGTHGDWRVRGALSTGGLASWVAVGEYEARDVRTHAFRAGLSYGAQGPVSRVGIILGQERRAVASASGQDHWRVRPGLEIDYGLRVDRYDYVEGQHFLSPRVGMRLAIAPRTYLTGGVSRVAVAPGVDEFLPPPTSGPWLPPERTFSTLVSGADFLPERVQRYDAGVEHDFGVIGQPRTVGVRWFHETSRDQLATLFDVDSAGSVGHYYVGTPGSVTLDGWAVSMSGTVTTRVRASVDYSVSRARWMFGNDAAAIGAVMPSAVRPTRERLHDVTSMIEASIPETDTRVTVAYRLNSAFARAAADGRLPITDGRFAVQVRQALPFQPITGGRIEFMVNVSNLFRDPHQAGSFYDELLTVRTPRRVMGGVQVRF